MEITAKQGVGLQVEAMEIDPLRGTDSAKFRPAKVQIFAENSRYLLKVAESEREFREAMQLRYEVFHCEYRGIEYQFGIDTDEFDKLADILVIMDKRSGKIVGTYRILCSDYTDDFYGNEEFYIDGVTDAEGTKLELSRACVHKDARNGAVIHLLWKGIYQYIVGTGARYLFGCSSITGLSVGQLGAIQRHFIRQGDVLTDRDVYPRPQYYFDQEAANCQDEEQTQDPQQLIPSLLGMYLKAGAKVALIPAWDAYFECFDFFTLLDTQELNPAFIKAFGS